MAHNIEVTVTDLFKKHSGKSGYEGMYSIAKDIYQDDEQIIHNGFAIDKENLLILKAKIRAILIDDLPKKKHHQLLKRSSRLYVIT
jgi:hypothetical protein